MFIVEVSLLGEWRENKDSYNRSWASQGLLRPFWQMSSLNDRHNSTYLFFLLGCEIVVKLFINLVNFIDFIDTASCITSMMIWQFPDFRISLLR